MIVVLNVLHKWIKDWFNIISIKLESTRMLWVGEMYKLGTFYLYMVN